MAVLIAEHLEDDRLLLQAYCKESALEMAFASDGHDRQSGGGCGPGSRGELRCSLGKTHFEGGSLSAIKQPQTEPAAAESTVLIQIPEGMEEMARGYLTSREKEVSVFRGLMDQSDLDGIRKLAHNLKGTGTSYGFPDITRLGAAIERAAKASDKPEASREIAALFSYIENASRQLGLHAK